VETIRRHIDSRSRRGSKSRARRAGTGVRSVVTLALFAFVLTTSRAAGAAGPARDTLAVRSSAPATSVAPASPDSTQPVAPIDSLPGRIEPLPGTLDLGGHEGLTEPSGIAIDAFGRFVVTDAASHRILRFDRSGAWLGEMGSLGSDPGQLRRPTAVVRLGSLGVAVLDRENRRVVSYDLLGQRIGVVVDFASDDLTNVTGRVDPIGMASDKGGALYLADADRDRILVFDFQGRYQREIGGYGTKPGAFRGLAGIATTTRGEIVACERGGQRVQVLDAGGRVVRAWPISVEPGRDPLPVAVDDSSRVALADGKGASGALRVYDRGGRLWAAREEIVDPRALAFAPDGSLFVAERLVDSKSRIRRFALVSATGAPRARGD